MAKQGQTWRDPATYDASSDEEDKKSSPKDATEKGHLAASVGRPQQNFSHPVFKQISKVNSFIHSLTTEELGNKLRELGISDRGTHDVKCKRLKSWVRTSRLKEANVEVMAPSMDYIVAIDFEATCEEENPPGFPHEIIEFPAVLISVKEMEIEAEFHSYCRPTINKELSQFCISLTGITQSKVDTAPNFETVLKRFDAWLKTVLKPEETFAVLTDGPWDIAKFLSAQCKSSKLQLPHYCQTWINVRKHFRNFYKVNQQNLQGMLDTLGMDFVGRPHSGIDDTRNIARIVIQLLKDGCDLAINETFG